LLSCVDTGLSLLPTARRPTVSSADRPKMSRAGDVPNPTPLTTGGRRFSGLTGQTEGIDILVVNPSRLPTRSGTGQSLLPTTRRPTPTRSHSSLDVATSRYSRYGIKPTYTDEKYKQI